MGSSRTDKLKCCIELTEEIRNISSKVLDNLKHSEEFFLDTEKILFLLGAVENEMTKINGNICQNPIPSHWIKHDWNKKENKACGWNLNEDVETKKNPFVPIPNMQIEEDAKELDKLEHTIVKQEEPKHIPVANSLFKQRCELLISCKDFVLKNFDIKEFPMEIRGALVSTLFIEICKNLRT